MQSIDSFCAYLSHEKKASQHTVMAYQTDLLQFWGYINQDEEVEQDIASANYPDIRSWIISMIDLGVAPQSVNRKLASLSHFYRFLQQKGRIEANPTEKLQALKTAKPLPDFVQETELSQILEETEFASDFKGQRAKLVLELLYGTGMRLSELIGLKAKDVDLKQRTVIVLGKGNKTRLIPITDLLSKQVGLYLQRFPAQSHEPIIRTEKGKKAYPMLIYRIVRQYLGVAQSAEKKSPHVLRHSYATHLLENGADLNAIKDLLGHASLSATQIYTHNSLSRLKEVFDKAHPKS